MGPAGREQVRAAVSLGERAQAVRPVQHQREVRTPHARLHQEARRVHHGVEALDLAAQRAGQRLVQHRRPFLHAARIDQCRSLRAQGAELEIKVAGLASSVTGLLCPPFDLGGVAAARRSRQEHPRVECRHTEWAGDAPGTRRPPGGHRQVPEVGLLSQADGDGDPHRLGGIRATDELGVGRFPVRDRLTDLAEPPARGPEPQERLRCALEFDRPGEDRSRRNPVTPRQRLAADLEKILDLRHPEGSEDSTPPALPVQYSGSAQYG